MILQVSGVSKHFGGLQALSNVTFELDEGRILGLIGPNGAGKTTLFNVINGVYAPDEGQVIFRGKDISGMKPYRIARDGLARAHQIVRPLNELSVRENVMAGACFGRETQSLSARRAHRRRGAGIRRHRRARRSTCRAASTSGRRNGWKWRARWRRVPICCCSTRCWPG